MPDLGRKVVQQVDVFKGAPGSGLAEVGLSVDEPGCALAGGALAARAIAARAIAARALAARTHERTAGHGADLLYRRVLDEAFEQLAP